MPTRLRPWTDWFRDGARRYGGPADSRPKVSLIRPDSNRLRRESAPRPLDPRRPWRWAAPDIVPKTAARALDAKHLPGIDLGAGLGPTGRGRLQPRPGSAANPPPGCKSLQQNGPHGSQRAVPAPKPRRRRLRALGLRRGSADPDRLGSSRGDPDLGTRKQRRS